MDDGRDPRADDETWTRFYERLRTVLQQFGSEDSGRDADCRVDDEHWGQRQQKFYIQNLAMLRPPVVTAVQKLLDEFPGWEVAAAAPAGEKVRVSATKYRAGGAPSYTQAIVA